MMKRMAEMMDRNLTDYQGEIRKEMSEVKMRLDKIEKITDRVEKNEEAIQEIETTLKTENQEIKDKIEEINLNNIMEEASRSVYIHNVDVLIGMNEPKKQNLINWTEKNDLKPYVADVITVKAEDQTNAIFKGNNALAAKQIKDVLVKAKNDLKGQNKDFKTNNKGKKMYAGIDPYIPPQAKDDYQKLRTHAKKQKDQKNLPQIQHLNKTIRIWHKQTIRSCPRLHHQRRRRKMEIDHRQPNQREETKDHTSCRPLLKRKSDRNTRK